MKGNLLSFLILPSIVFALFLVFSPVSAAYAGHDNHDHNCDHGCNNEEESVCVATTCGSTVGTRQEKVKKCNDVCPSVNFSSKRKVVDVAGHFANCPNGYEVDEQDESKCVGKAFRYADKRDRKCPDKESSYTSTNDHKDCKKMVNVEVNRDWVESTYKFVDFGPISISYVKSEDGKICVRPSEEILSTVYGLNHDEIGKFTHDNSRTKNLQEKCEWVDGSVPCNNAPLVACEPEYEQCSVTTPSYGNWGDWMVDNEDESLLVGKRVVTYYDSVETEFVCSTSDEKQIKNRPLCQYEGVTYADDPLCVPIDNSKEVLGTTSVAKTDTAGGLDASAYILQYVLVMITSGMFLTLGYEYLKK